MATFTFNHKKIYYEVHGEGKPILILNGIMMSTQSWQMFMPALQKSNQVILVDFFDQGQTEKLEGAVYKQDIQVELVYHLLKHLNINKV